MTPGRRLAVAAWLGFALTGLFLYPLAVALGSDMYDMQWQTSDLAETVAAWAILAVLFGAAVFALRGRTTRAAAIALLALCALPVASFAAGVLRQLPFDDFLRDAADQLKKLLGANPSDARAHLSLGNLYAQPLQQPELAREHYQRVLELNPRHAEAAKIRFWLTSNP